MSIVEAYVLRCDNCKVEALIYDGRRFMPQDVLVHASIKKNWTIHGELAHCADCPPLCNWCGTDCDSGWCPTCAVASGPS